MADWGVFAVSRDIWDHPRLSGEPFTRREAWMWLISAAAWKPIKIGWRGAVIDLERGEFCFALSFLAKRWKWALSKVNRFISMLKTADMIMLQNRNDDRNDTCVYSINNYNKFQVVGLPNRNDVGNDIGTTSERHRKQEETFKHSNIEETPSLRSGFTQEPVIRSAPKRKSQIPDERPSQADKAAAVKFWTEHGRADLCATVTDEADQFRDRCLARGETALDWSAKWRTWYRNALKFNQKANRNGYGRQESSHEQTERVARELIAELNARDAAGDHGRDREAGNSLPRVLTHDPGIAPGMDHDAVPGFGPQVPRRTAIRG